MQPQIEITTTRDLKAYFSHSDDEVRILALDRFIDDGLGFELIGFGTELTEDRIRSNYDGDRELDRSEDEFINLFSEGVRAISSLGNVEKSLLYYEKLLKKLSDKDARYPVILEPCFIDILVEDIQEEEDMYRAIRKISKYLPFYVELASRNDDLDETDFTHISDLSFEIPVENTQIAANRIVQEVLSGDENSVMTLQVLLKQNNEELVIAALNAYLEGYGGGFVYKGRLDQGEKAWDIYDRTAQIIHQDEIQKLFLNLTESTLQALFSIKSVEEFKNSLQVVIDHQYKNAYLAVAPDYRDTIFFLGESIRDNTDYDERHFFAVGLFIDQYQSRFLNSRSVFENAGITPNLLLETLYKNLSANYIYDFLLIQKQVLTDEKVFNWVRDYSRKYISLQGDLKRIMNI